MTALTGQRIVVEKTYAQMAALIAAEELNPFLWYKITDRGDRGLVFRAAATNRLESTGLRYMLCPATYAAGLDAYDNDWIGVWNSVKQATATEGQLTIWNGLVWTAGATLSGDAPDTEASGWTVIPKASFTNHEYIEMIFGVDYDFENDWISKQWDDNGNMFGVSKSVYIYLYEPNDEDVNLIDYCDWNKSTDGGYLFDNKCVYLFNNSCGSIFQNRASDISFNSCNTISYNNVLGGIRYCSNSGTIDNNTCSNIEGNSINGSISLNKVNAIENNSSLNNVPVNILYNINNGSITGVWDADVTDAVVHKTGTAE